MFLFRKFSKNLKDSINWVWRIGLFWVLLGILCVYVVDNLIEEKGSYLITVVFLFSIVLFFLLIKKWRLQNEFYLLNITLLVGSLLFFGFNFYCRKKEHILHFNKEKVSAHEGQETTLKILIDKEPIQSHSDTKYVGKIISIENTGAKRNVCQTSSFGKIVLRIPRYPYYSIGVILLVKGIVYKTQNVSYLQYLRRHDINIQVIRAKVSKIGETEDFFWRFLRFTFHIKGLVVSLINRMLPEPHAALMAGYLLGVQSTLPADFSESLRVTGTTHIVAISGYNMTVILDSLLKGTSKFLAKRKA